jgi:hypothetical protein
MHFTNKSFSNQKNVDPLLVIGAVGERVENIMLREEGPGASRVQVRRTPREAGEAQPDPFCLPPRRCVAVAGS